MLMTFLDTKNQVIAGKGSISSTFASGFFREQDEKLFLANGKQIWHI